MSNQASEPQREQERERDIETARRFYGDFQAFEVRIEDTIRPMHNRGRWLDALNHLRKARESLQLFIGQRMTVDIDEAYSQALQDAIMPPGTEVEE